MGVLYAFEAADGTRIAREYDMGKAPKLGCPIRVGRKTYRRIYDTAPVHVSDFAAGRRRSVSYQLPTYYGFRNSDAVWKRHLNRIGLDDTKDSRRFARDRGLEPPKVLFEAEARRNAAKAGKLDSFDEKGRPVASTLKGTRDHVGRGRSMGDEIDFD